MHHAALDPYQLDLICNGTDLKIIKKSNLIAIQVILLDLFANLYIVCAPLSTAEKVIELTSK